MPTLREPARPSAANRRILTVDAEGGLDVWSRPGVSSDHVGGVPHGDSVTVTAVRKHWVRLGSPREGWVPAALLSRDQRSSPTPARPPRIS